MKNIKFTIEDYEDFTHVCECDTHTPMFEDISVIVETEFGGDYSVRGKEDGYQYDKEIVLLKSADRRKALDILSISTNEDVYLIHYSGKSYEWGSLVSRTETYYLVVGAIPNPWELQAKAKRVEW